MAKKKVSKKSKPAKKNPVLAVHKKEEFFVALGHSSSVRLPLLEARKTLLKSMQLFQSIKDVRKKKIGEKNKLRQELREISSIIGKMKATMPKVNLPQEELPIQQNTNTASKKEEQPRVEEPKPAPHTELSRIESDLLEIERKLSGI